MSDNIKVVVKLRPLITREIEEKQQHHWRVNNNTLSQLDGNGRDSGQTFTFDKVYCENIKTSDVYNDVAKPIVEAAVAGFNGTIFAYGQTSSGKTYTMTGTDESPGIIPLAVLNLFEIIKNVPGRDFVVSVSYIELYNEALRDLLDLKKVVNIHQTHAGSTKVDATEKVTASPEEVLEAMKEGNANRQTASTNMNESSSRSHSIFRISIESREHIEGEEQPGCVNVSELNLVDLAGSERAGQQGSKGMRFKEGTAINQSLTSLALVIKHLSENQFTYINYRDSKLTRILQNSLGGNAKTSIICTITPAAIEETNSTLQFATRAKTIKNKPEVNAVATDRTMIQRLTKELSMLLSQLESKKNLEMMLETKKNVEQDLQKKIANLQRFILNGCGQRPNVELMGGARRKLLPPRRITISTLHPIEDDVPKVPKFNTPCLKYNPSLMPNTADFRPIQNSSKLSSLPEEPPRLVTPPPSDQKVYFRDEVIELDSDDDDASSVHTCSPYHKCHNPTKTPPCILRKNAKQAEKNLNDLIELTDREKMYTPSVVELIEKIEQSTAKTAKLQDEIEVLKTTSKEKDFEIESLRSKINTTEANIQSFTSVTADLKAQREAFTTKLTDWEVSYETLKTKAKLREQELLSLLEEQRNKQADDIGHVASKTNDKEILQFLDMSKNISLVNSDTETSMVSPDDDEPSERTNILIRDMQAQLAAKNQIISELETDINTQKHQIILLEKSSHDLISQVDSFKEKIYYLENENVLLQSTVNELNCTIKSQKENLELAHNDMNSYKSVIQELQIKLTQKENMLDMHTSDAILESMLTNEDKTIANNENIKNIIHSFKQALENSKKEIDLLKSKMKNNNESGDKDSIDNLKMKAKQIEILNEEIFKFTKQANENMVTINKLLREKGDLALIEQELIKKISDVEQRNSEYDILSKEQAVHIDRLKKDNERLDALAVICKAEKEQLHNTNETLVKQIQETTNEIALLKEDIKSKDSQVTNLNTINNEFQGCLHKAKLAICKLQDVFKILTGDVREIPEILDSFVVIYNTLNDNLNILENIAYETMTEKDFVQNSNIELQNAMAALVLQHKSQISDMSKETEVLNVSIQKLTNEIKLLNDMNSKQSNKIINLKQELNNKNIELKNFEVQHKAFIEAAKHAATSEKDLISLKENEVVLLEKNEKLQTETNNLMSALKLQEHENNDLNNKRKIDMQQLNELKGKLQQKFIELTQAKEDLHVNQNANDQLVENIIRKLSYIIDNIREKNSSLQNSLMFENSDVKEPNDIFPILDAVIDHMLLQSPIEIENIELKNKMVVISNYNKSLECDLKKSSELLQQIQEELKIKSAEIDVMKNKTKEWNNEFIDLDMTMKEQMLFLQEENKKLKTRTVEFNETKMQFDLLAAEKSAETSSRKSFVKSNAIYENNGESSLPSLFTICCNRIIEVIDQKQTCNISATTPSPCVGSLSTGSPANICPECDQLLLELRTTQQENTKLIDSLDELETVNKELTREHNEVSDEVRLLLELTQELQKIILHHRTNLSILTATTYTENKSLQSQVKGLQHHHSRFHNVCQRDIPEFKKQLDELLSILKDDSSFGEGLNSSYKRFSLPNLLENTLASCQIRNESTFTSDLLMLDTNVTVTTADNTLVEYNQTSFDLTQNIFNETDSQTVDHNVTEPNMLRNQIDILRNDNEDMSAKLEMLRKENTKLQEQVLKHLDVKDFKVKDTQSSPIKITDDVKATEFQNILKELKLLTEQLSAAKNHNKDVEKKYNDLVLEMPSTDALVHKMKAVEEDLKIKTKELFKVTEMLNNKSKELKALQDENDLLSTQVMEHISEADDLNKEVKQLKQQNLVLHAQYQTLDLDKKSTVCPQCGVNDNMLNCKPRYNENNSKLNRSLSESDNTLRINKICTLQSEIHAGREDCKVLTEDVATIKHHLDHSNMSMDLDDSMNFELANDSLPSSPQSKKCNLPDIQEELSLDVYLADKKYCYNFYLDKTGVGKGNLTSNMKIIEIMKLLHNNLVTRHGNEVENLANKLKDYQESQVKLQSQINVMKADYSIIEKELEKKERSLNIITNVVTKLRNNLTHIEPSDIKPLDFESYTKIANLLKYKFLTILDENFNLCSVNVFEQITGNINKLFEDHSLINIILTDTKYHLSVKEKEYNLLKAESDGIQEINNAVKLDIMKKEQDNESIIKKTYQKLIDLNMISPDKVPLTEPVNVHVLIRLLEHFINKYQKEKAKSESSPEINDLKMALAEKVKQLNELRSQNELLQSVINQNAVELPEKDGQIKKLKASQNELNDTLNIQLKENAQNLNAIQNMSEDINKLKEIINNKEKIIQSLYENDAKVNELLQTVTSLQDNNEKLKAVNEMISKERESYAFELQKSCATIKQNNTDIDKMTSDILVLRESMKEATAHMEKLKKEVQTLAKENVQVKHELEVKSRDCSRLEINIKTHEKTAEIQSRMIMRLQKLKEEDDKEHSKKLTNELTEKCAALQAECEALRNTINTSIEEVEHLKIAKQALENRLAEAEESGRRSRSSLNAVSRRRQSLHDSKRLFDESEEHKNLGAALESRQKTDDFFDDGSSGRSTPFGLGKGRDSLLSRTDHSDKDEEHPSRPSSVLAKAARRRRQSSHDLHRSVTPHAPSPTDLSNYVIDETQQFKVDTSRNRLLSDNEITQLRTQLGSCEQELEELKERYRELDEECETCAEYLRERDEQCIRLKKEKAALENQVKELKTKAATTPSNLKAFNIKPSVSHVSVNTDEDWTNLHSVVVDRMSYDAEVEKNKKLAKTIEELRFTKLDLKNTLARMQKALERNTAKDNSRELEQTRKQLKASNDELRELRTRYKELDEECETCAKYLKEREQQCCQLKEAKAALETKLEELQEKSRALEHTKSLRKKRQTIHDMNRIETSTAEQMDVSTETTNDFLDSQVERDDTQERDEASRDINYLKTLVGSLTQQKMHLELQLRTAHAANPMFVATGSAIVQNQQITDVMKENQKLKKINAKLVNICRKRGKSANRENEDPCEQG